MNTNKNIVIEIPKEYICNMIENINENRIILHLEKQPIKSCKNCLFELHNNGCNPCRTCIEPNNWQSKQDLSNCKIFIGDNPKLSELVKEKISEIGWKVHDKYAKGIYFHKDKSTTYVSIASTFNDYYKEYTEITPQDLGIAKEEYEIKTPEQLAAELGYFKNNKCWGLLDSNFKGVIDNFECDRYNNIRALITIHKGTNEEDIVSYRIIEITNKVAIECHTKEEYDFIWELVHPNTEKCQLVDWFKYVSINQEGLTVHNFKQGNPFDLILSIDEYCKSQGIKPIFTTNDNKNIYKGIMYLGDVEVRIKQGLNPLVATERGNVSTKEWLEWFEKINWFYMNATTGEIGIKLGNYNTLSVTGGYTEIGCIKLITFDQLQAVTNKIKELNV